MIEKQLKSETILPDGVQEDVFTLVVADKIARKEETLSGKNISFTKDGWKLHLMTLLYSFLMLLYLRK